MKFTEAWFFNWVDIPARLFCDRFLVRRKDLCTTINIKILVAHHKIMNPLCLVIGLSFCDEKSKGLQKQSRCILSL